MAGRQRSGSHCHWDIAGDCMRGWVPRDVVHCRFALGNDGNAPPRWVGSRIHWVMLVPAEGKILETSSPPVIDLEYIPHSPIDWNSSECQPPERVDDNSSVLAEAPV